MNVNKVSVKHHGDDYIGQMLILRPQIRSKEQLKCMYSECLDGIGEFKDIEYHTELDPVFKPRKQTPHEVALSIEPRQRKELDQMKR